MFRKILIANDGSEGGARALSAAIKLAKEQGSELHMSRLRSCAFRHRSTRSSKKRARRTTSTSPLRDCQWVRRKRKG
jgi:hypothetical protein